VVLAWSKLDWMDPKVVDLLARPLEDDDDSNSHSKSVHHRILVTERKNLPRPLSELTESNTVHLHRIGFDDLQNGLVILDLVAPPESCAP
jgi:hypothetical protein